MEQGHQNRGSVLTHDICGIPACVQPVLLCLFRSLGALTRAQRMLLGGVDLHCLQQYEELLQKL